MPLQKYEIIMRTQIQEKYKHNGLLDKKTFRELI